MSRRKSFELEERKKKLSGEFRIKAEPRCEVYVALGKTFLRDLHSSSENYVNSRPNHLLDSATRV